MQWIKSCLHRPFYERSHIPMCQLKSLRSLETSILSQKISVLEGDSMSRDLLWNTMGLSVVEAAFRQMLEQQNVERAHRQASQVTRLKIFRGHN